MAVVARSNGVRRRAASSPASGFSLVEMLVASLLLIFIVLGIVPLFVRSMANNSGGNTFNQLNNFGKSQVEEIFQLDFDHPRLTIPAGETEVKIEDYWSAADKTWKAGPTPAGETALWLRTTTVRQFSVAAVDKVRKTLDFESASALGGGAAGSNVHLKEIIVEIRNASSGPLGPQRTLELRTLKAK